MASHTLPILAKPTIHSITADLLIPGRGEPIKDGCIIVSDNIIQFVGKITACPQKFLSAPRTHVQYLLPGLWDCHMHLLGTASQLSMDAFVDISPVLAGARGARDCAAILNAGFTSVRELAGYGIELQKAIDEGAILGPTIYSSSVALSMTGGHADAHNVGHTLNLLCEV